MINPIEYVRERRTRRQRKQKLWMIAAAVIAVAGAAIGAWWATRGREDTLSTSGLPGTDHVTGQEAEQTG